MKMELGQDWVTLQEWMNPVNRSKSPRYAETAALVVNESGKCLRVVSDSDLLSEQEGQNLGNSKLQFEQRHKGLVLEVENLEEALIGATRSETSLYSQILALRSRLTPIEGCLPPYRENFLVQTVRSHWGKFLPSTFGVWITLREDKGSSILLIFKQGRLEYFGTPDLSHLSEERKSSMEEIVKYLKERYLVPIQGVVLAGEDWASLCGEAHPWKKAARLLRQNKLVLVPFRFSVAAMMGARGIF